MAYHEHQLVSQKDESNPNENWNVSMDEAQVTRGVRSSLYYLIEHIWNQKLWSRSWSGVCDRIAPVKQLFNLQYIANPYAKDRGRIPQNKTRDQLHFYDYSKAGQQEKKSSLKHGTKIT